MTTQDSRKPAIRIELAGVLVPKTKWEPDLIEGGVRKVVSIAFAIPNLPDGITSELAAQSFANNLAHVTIELLGPTFYFGDLEDGEVLNAKTGDIQATIYRVNGVSVEKEVQADLEE